MCIKKDLLFTSNIHLYHHRNSSRLILERLLSSSNHHQIQNRIRNLYFLASYIPPFKLNLMYISIHKGCYIHCYSNNCCYHRNRRVVRKGLWTIKVHYCYNSIPLENLLNQLKIVLNLSYGIYYSKSKKWLQLEINLK